MKPGQRKFVLGIVLALTLAATFWTHRAEESQSELTEVAEINRPVSNSNYVSVNMDTSGAVLDIALPEYEIRQVADDETAIEIRADIFQAQSWYVPPPPTIQAVEAVAPPAPVAPVLPFTYMGQLEDNEESLIYLGYGDRALSLKVGDMVDEKYRLDKLEAGQLVFTYLPMGVTQTLKIGS